MKNVGELTIQELEDLAKGFVKKESSKKDNKTVMNFIKDKNIQRGNIKTATSLIYHQYYTNYNKYFSRDKVGRVSFFHTFAKYFDIVRSNGKRYYLLNDAFEITPETIKKANQFTERRRQK